MLLTVRKDWKVAVLCVSVAATFWFLNALNSTFTANISYPIRLKYNEKTVIPVSPLPKRVTINVTGIGWNLLRRTFWFNIEPVVYAPHNLPHTQYANISELFQAFKAQLGGVKVNNIVTDTLFFDFDSLVTRQLPVTLDSSTIAIEPGYSIIGAIQTKPKTLLCKGPARQLRDLSSGFTLRLPSKSNISQDYEVTISVQDEHYPLIKISPAQVTVNFKVAPMREEVLAIPTSQINFPHHISPLNPDNTVNVSYLISADNRTKTDIDSFVLEADKQAYNQADSLITIKVKKKPAFVQQVRVLPESIRAYEK